MDINAVIQAVSMVGFPIVAAGAMFWMVNKQNDQHKEEMNVVKEALNANTLALVELKNALEDRKE